MLYWKTQGSQLEVCICQEGWTVGNPPDVEYATEVIEGGVPAEGWKAPAQAFLQSFELFRHAPVGAARPGHAEA